MGKNWRMGNDEKIKGRLVTNGIFSLTRNPVYLGIILIGVSAFIIMPNIISLVLALFLIIDFNLIIKTEEEFLEKTFGKEYLQYKKKAKRFL